MSEQKLEALIQRLESAVNKLESKAGGQGAAAAKSDYDPDALEIPPLDDFKALLNEFVELGQKLDQLPLHEVTHCVKNAAEAMVKVILFTASAKKPGQDVVVQINKALQEHLSKIKTFNTNKEVSLQAQAIMDGVSAFFWILTEQPDMVMKGAIETSEFTGLKLHKLSIPAHTKWHTAFILALKNLQNYAKQHYRMGLTWNPNGKKDHAVLIKSLSEVKEIKAVAPVAADKGALFAALNKGTDITTGLKKVTPDMKNKPVEALPRKPSLKVDNKPVQEKKPEEKVVKPPRKYFQGAGWYVENFVDSSVEITDKEAEMKHTIFIDNVSNSTIMINSKVKSIMISKCTKMSLIFKAVVSSVEMVTSKRLEIICNEKSPTYVVDSCQGVHICMAQDNESDVVSSKTTELNVTYKLADGELAKDQAAPEQFITRFDKKSGKFVTQVYSLFTSDIKTSLYRDIEDLDSPERNNEDDRALESLDNQEYFRAQLSNLNRRPQTTTNNEWGRKNLSEDQFQKLNKKAQRPESKNQILESRTQIPELRRNINSAALTRNSMSSADLKGVSGSSRRKNETARGEGFLHLLPRHITQEKEQLYEEALTLKTKTHSLEEENLKLRTKIHAIEREKAKYEENLKIMKDEQAKKSGGNASIMMMYSNQEQTNLIKGLRNQNNELKKEIDTLTQKIEIMKRSVKMTRVNELEAELKAYAEETARLRMMLENALELLSQSEESENVNKKRLLSSGSRRKIKLDNIQMTTIIRELEYKLKQSDLKADENKKNVEKGTKEKNYLKKLLSEKEMELEHIKAEQASGGNMRGSLKNLPTPLETQLKADLEKKSHENSNLFKVLNTKEKNIVELEKKLKELNAEHQEKILADKKDRQNFLLTIEKLKKENIELRDKQQVLIQSKSLLPPEMELSRKKSDYGDSGNNNSLEKKRMPRVKNHEVETIGLVLRYNLMSNDIPHNEIEKYLFNSSIQYKKSATISDMKEILRNDPFRINDERQLLLIARYLVETSDEDYIEFSQDCENDTDQIKTIFKKLVHYTLITEEQQKEFRQVISETIIKFQTTFLDSIKNSNMKGKSNQTQENQDSFVSKTDLDHALSYIDAKFTPQQLDYLYLVLFKDSKDINKFKIDSIIQNFGKPKDANRR